MQNQKIVFIALGALLVVGTIGAIVYSRKDNTTVVNSPVETTQNNNNPTAALTPTPSNTQTSSDKNPGESINPVDKDKVKASDVFSYKLLDARKAQTTLSGTTANVLLVKLEVENISKWTRNLSSTEVRLSEQVMKSAGDKNLKIDFLFPRSQMGIDLAGAVKELKPGQKVVGYYSYTLPSEILPTNLYLNLLNLGNPEAKDQVDLSKSFKIADTFVLK